MNLSELSKYILASARIVSQQFAGDKKSKYPGVPLFEVNE